MGGIVQVRGRATESVMVCFGDAVLVCSETRDVSGGRACVDEQKTICGNERVGMTDPRLSSATTTLFELSYGGRWGPDTGECKQTLRCAPTTARISCLESIS